MRNINLSIPEKWEALSDRQLLRLSSLLFTPLQPIALDVRILMELLSIRWYHFKRYIRLKWALRTTPISDLKKHYLWVYKPSQRTTFIHHNTHKGPASFLLDVTIAEFAVVDDLYMRYSKAKTTQDRRDILEYMAAVLYVPKGYNRAHFKKENLETLRSAFAKEKDPFLHATLITYQGCRNGLEKRYPRIFKKTDQTRSVLGAPKKQYGFGKVILAMAGGRFGNYAETSTTPVHTFMEQFNEDLKPN